MRRPCVTTIFTLALALAPALSFAQATTAQQPGQSSPPAGQQPTAGQPPAGQQPPAGGPPAGEQPAAGGAPKIGFTTPAGILLVQIKPDQTAVFEEMMGKLRAGVDKATDPTVKAQAASLKVYKSSEPFGANALYVITMDPAAPGGEYDLILMLNKTMTPEELRAPEAAEMWKRYAGAFAGLSKLSLTPLAK